MRACRAGAEAGIGVVHEYAGSGGMQLTGDREPPETTGRQQQQQDMGENGGPADGLSERERKRRQGKLAKKRKAKLREQQFDDCGSDFGPLARDVGVEETACYASARPEWLEFILWGEYASRTSEEVEVHT